jgi:hypothetical protein
MAMLAGQYGPTGLEYPDGRHAVGVYITVYAEDGTPAVLYVNSQKSGVAPNPVTTDALGNLMFFAEPGSYTLGFDGIELPIVVDVHPGEPAPELGFTWEQTLPEAVWECPYPFGFEPAGFHIEVDGFGHIVAAPISYGAGRVFVYHGAPCTGRVRMS